jgi:suppressor of tumorigenicity protein 14
MNVVIQISNLDSNFLYYEGFQCKTNEFKCDNGRCVNKSLRCNGVKDGCIDGSDEKGCDCPTGHLKCSDKKCIKHDRLCDSIKDCQDGMDERHCGKVNLIL